MGKNAPKTLPGKRKLSANNSEDNPKNKLARLNSSSEKNKRKIKEVLVNEKCKDTLVVNAELSNYNKTGNSVKKLAKEVKNNKQNIDNKARKTIKSSTAKTFHNEESENSQDSSDDHLPLSEVLKRKNPKQNVEEKSLKEGKANKLSKLKTSSSTKANELKDVKDAKTSIKKPKQQSHSSKAKSVAVSSKSIAEPTGSSQLSNETNSSKMCSPNKNEKNVKDYGDDKVRKTLTKNEGRSPLKTKAGKEKSIVGKEKSLDYLSLKKEVAKERKVDERNIEDCDDEEDGEDSEMDWEDVAEVSGVYDDNDAESEVNMPSTSSNIEVTISVPGKKSKCGKPSKEEIRKWIQRKINRIKKEGQITAHKVHFLALLAVGMKKNEMCNNNLVQAVGLSLLPIIFTQRKDLKTWDIPFLTRITTWMKNKAPSPGDVHTGNSEATYLMRVLEKKVYLLIVILRALGLSVRLVMSLQVLNNKIEEVSKTTKKGAKKSKTPGKTKKPTQPAKTPTQSAKKETKVAKKTPKETLLNKLKNKSSPGKQNTPSSSKTLRKKAKVDYSEETRSEYFKEGETSAKYFSSDASNFSDDDDFEVPLISPKRGRSAEPRPREPLQDAPAVDETSGIVKKGCDIWIEVYLEKEKKWICIDGDISSVNQPEECEKLATKPIKYVITFDNECSLKDVTSRYASDWLTTTPKLRADADWLTETMNVYRSKNVKREKKEDSFLKARLLQKPLPQTVSEYKNHPLYVLKRHLLKFEAIYPETAATLGFCRGEAVYSRECVHILHTRELWMKEARVVKGGEQPYKIVKGRKSRRKMLENVGEVKAELFGRWQTEDYIPPPVVDGIIPRNEYGNVELFKPCMLPAGACHIQVPGIHRLARKLKIDAVPAVVGFDFHGGFNHPIIDGVVVSEEYKEQLLLAWEKEQEEKQERERAKREKRALDNWKHLVKSLRIRERLRRKYNVEEENIVQKNKFESDDTKEMEDTTDISLSWPLNKQEGKTTRDDDGHCHVFLPANHVQDPVTGEWSKVCACGLKEPLETL